MVPKEKKLSELEEGNLVTAESASLNLLDLKSGRMALTGAFKQGGFEIVAPERIGAKFADRVNRYFKELRKQRKRMSKN